MGVLNKMGASSITSKRRTARLRRRAPMQMRYQDLYRMNRVAAREKLLESFQRMGSISATARAWGTSRQVVRKYLKRFQAQGPAGLEDARRRPRNSPRQTPTGIEHMVVLMRKTTNFGCCRLARQLKESGLDLATTTIWAILRRRGIRRPKRRKTIVGRGTYYDWDRLYPLEQFQVDLKEILDIKALPLRVYEHIITKELPPYQWTAIDVKTRLRFLAYSYEKSFTNGLFFMSFLAHWLHALGVRVQLFFQSDWGEELGGRASRSWLASRPRYSAP